MGGRVKREGLYVSLWLIPVEVWQGTEKFCKAIILQLKKKKKIGELSRKRKVFVETWVRRETGARERDWGITVSLQGKWGQEISRFRSEETARRGEEKGWDPVCGREAQGARKQERITTTRKRKSSSCSVEREVCLNNFKGKIVIKTPIKLGDRHIIGSPEWKQNQ